MKQVCKKDYDSILIKRLIKESNESFVIDEPKKEIINKRV